MFCSTISGFNSDCLNLQELGILPRTVLPSPNKHSLSISNFAQNHWWYHLLPNLLLLLFFLFYPSLLGVLKGSKHEASPLTDLLGSEQDTTGTKAESILWLLFFQVTEIGSDHSPYSLTLLTGARTGEHPLYPFSTLLIKLSFQSGVTKNHLSNQTSVLENFTFPSKFPLKFAQAAVLRWLALLSFCFQQNSMVWVLSTKGPANPQVHFPRHISPSIFLTSYYHGGNLIHMFLVHLHSTHQNVAL